SDALLVPKNCIFDHVHEANHCRGFDDWNATAIAACAQREDGHYKLESFSMIQPCGIDRFTGTEFVCCP
ncbi:hypothetical protein HELRODRAFT_138653, partial [Helobdella robusta]|uniref:E1 domain-containing protein n=1 Tax=Helobdella robusta TaxID=6412 RepID=T1EIW3_HELRO